MAAQPMLVFVAARLRACRSARRRRRAGRSATFRATFVPAMELAPQPAEQSGTATIIGRATTARAAAAGPASAPVSSTGQGDAQQGQHAKGERQRTLHG